MKKLESFGRQAAKGVASLFIALALAASGLIRPCVAAITTGLPDVDSAISTLAAYSGASYDETDKFLARTGFSHQRVGVDDKTWGALSPHSKIVSAYQAAENAAKEGKASSGKAFLLSLQREIGLEYQAARAERLFGDVAGPSSQAAGIHFSRGPPSTPLLPAPASLPTETKAAIATLAKYTAPGTMGEPHTLLHSWFPKVSPEKALDLVLENPWEKAIEHGLRIQTETGSTSNLDPGLCRTALRPAILQTTELFQAAQSEAAFKSVFTAASSGSAGTGVGESKPPGTPPGFGGGGGGGGGSPARQAAIQSHSSNYRSFTTKNYPTPSSRSFRAVRASAGGFGGIVLGNTVEVDDSLKGKRVAAVQLELPDSSLSHAGENCLLRFRFVDGTEMILDSVALDHAKVASRILYKTFNVPGADPVTPPAKGEAIGLISLRSSLNEESTTHPSLIGESLWRSLTGVDQLENQDQGPYLISDGASGWVEKYADSIGLKTWKITDASATIALGKDGKLEVRATHLDTAGRPLNRPHLKSVYFEGVFWGVAVSEEEAKEHREIQEEVKRLESKLADLRKRDGAQEAEQAGDSRKMLEGLQQLEQLQELLERQDALEKKLDAKQTDPPQQLPMWSERLRNDAPLLISGSDAFFQFNRFVRVLQALRWARDVGGAPEPTTSRNR